MIYGVKEAQYVQSKIRQLGIQDVQLFFDPQMSMWSICQVTGRSGSLLLPEKYSSDLKPSILWWIKDSIGRRRLPSDQDIADVIAVRQRAEISFDKGGDWLADQLDEQDKENYQKGREKLTKRIKDVAPELKRAIREELT